jgi:hypothetical protein
MDTRLIRRVPPLLACVAIVAGCSTAPTQSSTAPFEFGVIGDGPYEQASESPFAALIDDMNHADLAFVVHVGDIQADARLPFSGGIPTCTDESLKSRLDMFNASQHPFILTPGDNEWTDCHFVKERSVDPLERLEKLRTLFFASDQSLGQKRMTLEMQASDPAHAKYVENRRWSLRGVEFVTLHIVGSNDNFGRTPTMDREHAERTAANLAWLAQAFARARDGNARALVIVMQADPKFATTWSATQLERYLAGLPVPRPEQRVATGYDEFRTALERELGTFPQPVLLVHGDTHIFRVDKPLLRADGRVLDHFTRLESYGHPDVHWVRVRVDPSGPNLFSFSEEMGKEP